MATLGYFYLDSNYNTSGFRIKLTQTLDQTNLKSTFSVSEMGFYANWYESHNMDGTIKLNGTTIYTASAFSGDTRFYTSSIDTYVSFSLGGSSTPLTLSHGADGSLGNLTLTVDFQLLTNASAGSSFRGSCSGSVTVTPTQLNPVYTVSYNANGGSTTPSSQTFNGGSGIYLSGAITKPSTVSTSVFTVTGDANGGTGGNSFNVTKTNTTPYTFSSWKATNGTTYAGGAYYNAQASTTMTAQWSTGTTTTTYSSNTLSNLSDPSRASTVDAAYTVSFNANGGSSTHASQKVNKTSTYIFQGWGATADATTALSSSTTFTSATTVYAIWSQTTTTGSVSLPVPIYTGYIFKGWSTNPMATSGVTGTYTPTSDVTLYATWEVDPTIVKNEALHPYIGGYDKELVPYLGIDGAWQKQKVYISSEEE